MNCELYILLHFSFENDPPPSPRKQLQFDFLGKTLALMQVRPIFSPLSLVIFDKKHLSPLEID